jgi:hypothetical protein
MEDQIQSSHETSNHRRRDQRSPTHLATTAPPPPTRAGDERDPKIPTTTKAADPLLPPSPAGVHEESDAETRRWQSIQPI